MKKALLFAPAFLLILAACKGPEITYPSPNQTIRASAKAIAEVVEKDGPRLLAENSTGPATLDPSLVKVVRDANGVSLLFGRIGTATVSCDFTITPLGDGCSVTVNNGWQADGHPKTKVIERIRESHETNMRVLAEVKRRAEAAAK